MGIPKGKAVEPTVPFNTQSWSLHTMPFLLLGPLPHLNGGRQQVQSLSHQRLLAEITPGGSWAVSCSLKRSGTRWSLGICQPS